jgi:hypothetical protein
VSASGPLRERRYLAFPPGSGFLLLPHAPRRATLAGLALYDTVRPRQRLMLTAGTGLARLGLQHALPSNTRGDVDWSWWEQLAGEALEPMVGHVGHLALRVPPAPFSACGLYLADDGRPLAFVKADTPPPDPDEASVLELLRSAELATFRTPMPIRIDHQDGIAYRVLEPLPEGPHHDPPFDPPRLWRIIDEFRELLTALPRPPSVDAQHVPCHGDLHVRNLRRASDGQLWLFDWERFRWAPRLADELRYWSSHFGGRARGRDDEHARTVLDLLRRRGSDEEILAALRWPDYQPKRAVQRAVYAAVERALTGGEATGPAASGHGQDPGSLPGR